MIAMDDTMRVLEPGQLRQECFVKAVVARAPLQGVAKRASGYWPRGSDAKSHVTGPRRACLAHVACPRSNSAIFDSRLRMS